MNKDAFSGFHPAVNLAFFLAALGMTMLVQHPAYLLIQLVSGCAYLLYLQGRTGFLRQVGYLVPILVLMAVMNPMFNHEGVTVLWQLPNDNPNTPEAVCWIIIPMTCQAVSVSLWSAMIWNSALSTQTTAANRMERHLLPKIEPMIVDASKQMVRTEKGTITEIVDEDLRAFIESELVLPIIHTYDPYRMPDGQHITE